MVRKNGTLSKNFVVNELFIRESINQKLNLKEFLVLMSFINDDSKKLDVQKMANYLYISEEDIMSVLNSLIAKNLICIVSDKDENGKICDYIEIDGITSLMNSNVQNQKRHKTDNIYSNFEKEFARTLSSMEYELINGWIDSGFSDELILLALKEAVYNGVTNLRYIDKILFEWKKKGFKSQSDVDSYLQTRSEKKKQSKELYDYDWIENDEESK